MKNPTPFLAKGNASLLKRLLLTFVLCAPLLMGNLANPNEVMAQSSASSYDCGVSDAEVVKYLNEHGYTVYQLDPEPGTCNRIATTQNTYKTRVFISDGCIVGFEDIQ
jgi:hypothetical protein